MKISQKLIPFLEVAGLTFYVSIFAISVQTAGSILPPIPEPIIPMIIFLLLFVFSAIICSALMLGYPIYLFFDNRKQEAVKILIQSVIWLAIFFIIFVSLIILTK
ncbi:MAG: hypothetical protein AAB432_02370 [Patescibacteria group bacterium]